MSNQLTSPEIGPMREFETVPLEAVQLYWDSRPCNIRHSAKPIGTRDYFDEVEARKYLVEPHIPAFADFARWRGKRVLEIGCGIGTDTINFARAGANVTAIDLSPRSLELAQLRANEFAVSDRITFQCANGEELSATVPIAAYDLVYSFGVIHHTPRPDRVLAELRRYMKPNGTLKLMVYHRYSWKVFWIALTAGPWRFARIGQLIARYSEAQSGCPVTYTYTRGEARRLVESHGFRVVEMHVDHVFPYRIADYREYRYVKEWYFRWMPELLFQYFQRLFGWHLLITAEAK
jgi:2-polyprenyl-3-methyl-5-hydroxy-6-metoxy-1,4-benzoquinol methylase